jgi:hypothetical protein
MGPFQCSAAFLHYLSAGQQLCSPLICLRGSSASVVPILAWGIVVQKLGIYGRHLLPHLAQEHQRFNLSFFHDQKFVISALSHVTKLDDPLVADLAT